MKSKFNAKYNEIMRRMSLLNEAYEKSYVKLYDIVVAVDYATGNFRLAWEKGEMRELMNNALEKIKNSTIVVDNAEVENKLSSIKSFYQENPGALDESLKPILLNSNKNIDVDEYQMGYLAFAIWKAMKETKTKALNLNEKFKPNDKVNLTLTVVDYGESTYKKNYRAFGSDTAYATCESDEYPDVDFRFPVNDKMPHFKPHDIIKISGTVGNVSSTNVQVNLKRVKIEEILGEGGKEHGSSDKRTFTENSLHMEHNPNDILKRLSEFVQEGSIGYSYLKDLITDGFWEKSSKEAFMQEFDNLVKHYANDANVLRDDVEAYYDELSSIPSEKIPNDGNWYEYVN